MQIVSANVSLSGSYQLDVQSATVSAGSGTAAKACDGKSCSSKAAPTAQPDSDSYQGSVDAPAFGGHRMKRWLARLEHKLEKGDQAGAQKQVDQLLSRIVQMMERPGTDAIKQAGSDPSDPDAAASGSAVQVHDEAKVAFSLSFQTANGDQFSIDAAIDVSRDFARSQVTVQAA